MKAYRPSTKVLTLLRAVHDDVEMDLYASIKKLLEAMELIRKEVKAKKEEEQ